MGDDILRWERKTECPGRETELLEVCTLTGTGEMEYGRG